MVRIAMLRCEAQLLDRQPTGGAATGLRNRLKCWNIPIALNDPGRGSAKFSMSDSCG
jgi:hypothetical protein